MTPSPPVLLALEPGQHRLAQVGLGAEVGGERARRQPVEPEHLAGDADDLRAGAVLAAALRGQEDVAVAVVRALGQHRDRRCLRARCRCRSGRARDDRGAQRGSRQCRGYLELHENLRDNPPPRRKLPSRPITSNSPRRSRYAATSYRWRRERACCGDRGDGVTSASRRFTGGWNDRCEPFTWTKAADEILAKAIRKKLINVTSGTLSSVLTSLFLLASGLQPLQRLLLC